MNYLKITKCDIANGPGVRVVLWVAGCDCHCKGCHNPDSWDYNAGKPFDDEAKQELIDALSKPWIRGLTLSGGHPLGRNCNDSFYWFIKEIKDMFPDKDIWLYTGWKWETICDHDVEWDLVRECIDVVVDGPFVEELRDITLKFRGSSNQRLIDVKATLDKGEVVLYDRGD